MRMWQLTTVMAVVMGTVAGSADAGPAWGWRGDGTGHFPDADPPTQWGPDTNVVWKTALPGPSNASPIIVGDRLFVCYDKAGLACIDKADGRIRWSKTNDLRGLYTDEAWQGVEKRRAEWRRLNGERNQVIKDSRAVDQRLRVSTEAGRQRHTAGLRKQWQRRADAAKKRGKTVPPFKAPDYGPLPTAAQIEKMNSEKKALRAKRADLDRQMRDYQDVAPIRIDKVTGYSTPTPVTDGRHVYVLFASGVTVCYDLDGNRKWAVNLGPSTAGYGQSATPALAGDKLIVHLNGLKALEKATGRLAWSVSTPNKYGSLVSVRVAGRDAVITADGRLVRAGDGTIAPRGLGSLVYATPILNDGTVYFIETRAIAVRLPTTFTSARPTRLWTASLKKDRYYASTVLHDGILYAINQVGHASAVDAGDGTVVWDQKLDIGSTVYPSVTAAGRYVFFSSDTGKTAVVRAGRTCQVLGRNSLEVFRSSPVFEGRRLYIRGYQHLYCIGQR